MGSQVSNFLFLRYQTTFSCINERYLIAAFYDGQFVREVHKYFALHNSLSID